MNKFRYAVSISQTACGSNERKTKFFRNFGKVLWIYRKNKFIAFRMLK